MIVSGQPAFDSEDLRAERYSKINLVLTLYVPNNHEKRIADNILYPPISIAKWY